MSRIELELHRNLFGARKAAISDAPPRRQPRKPKRSEEFQNDTVRPQQMVNANPHKVSFDFFPQMPTQKTKPEFRGPRPDLERPPTRAPSLKT